MKKRFSSGLFLIIFVLSFIGLIIAADSASAKLYRWTDKKDQQHITDYPPSPDEIKNGTKVVAVEEEEKSRITFDKETPKKFLKNIQEIFNAAKKGDVNLILKLKVFLFIIIGIALLIHLYYALCLHLISLKVGLRSVVLSWIPILNIFQLVRAADRPWWGGLIFLAPLALYFPQITPSTYMVFALTFLNIVNFIIFVYLWMSVCWNLRVSKWLGFLIILPVVQFLFLGYLAFKREQQN